MIDFQVSVNRINEQLEHAAHCRISQDVILWCVRALEYLQRGKIKPKRSMYHPSSLQHRKEF